MADSSFRTKNAAVVRELVSDAQGSEEENRYLEAYVKYLKCVEFISGALLRSTAAGGLETIIEDVKFKQRLLSLAKDCLERSEKSLAAAAASLQHTPLTLPRSDSMGPSGPGNYAPAPQPSNCSHGNQPHSNSHTIHQNSMPELPNPNVPQHPNVRTTRFNSMGQSPSASLVMGQPPSDSLVLGQSLPCPPSSQGRPQAMSLSMGRSQVVPRPAPRARSDPGQHVLVDRAQHMNRRLMSIYQERTRRQESRGGVAPGRKEMSLGALRRLEESVSIAKAKEKGLQMKAKRLQQLKKFDQTSGVTKAKTEPDKLSSMVTQYERLKGRYMILKARLLKTPIQPASVKALLNEALGDKDHPMYKEFGKLQFFILEKLMVIVRQLDHTHHLPWLQESFSTTSGYTSSGGSTGGGGVSTGGGGVSTEASLFTGSMQRCDSQSPASSPQEPSSQNESEEGSGGGGGGSCNPFDSKLAALRSTLLEAHHQQPPLSGADPVEGAGPVKGAGPVEGDDDDDSKEDELMREMENEISSDPPPVVFPREPSPVTTGDISPSDLQEVFSNDRRENPGECPRVVVDSSSLESAGAYRPSCTLRISRERERMMQLQEKAAKELPQIVTEIQAALSALIHCVLSTYNIQDEQGEVRDVLEPIVESTLFPPLWPHLLTVFRLKNYTGECALAANMSHYFSCSPEDLQVREKFWLSKQPGIPYSAVLAEIERMVTMSCPTDKLTALVKSSKLIFQTIGEYYDQFGEGSGPKQSAIGVDDILPIVCYIVARTSKPQILSELNALEEFINESYILGEDGFCLTTFHTAVEYLKSVDQLTA